MRNSKLFQWGSLGLGLIAFSLMAPPAFSYPGGGQDHRRGPPPEAISACEGAGENEACAFEAPHGTVEGTCRSIREQMACAPEGGPRRPPRGEAQPPEEV
ncbi:MAG: hypothetical protein R3257_05305 [bacterium]|nr:hypothetical protein [bacterium]